MHERYVAYEALPAADRPEFWADMPCPKTHPASVITRARRGDQVAATGVLVTLQSCHRSQWDGMTVEELTELAVGDTRAVKARRKWKRRIRSRYYRNPAKYTRWSVSLSVELHVGSYLSTHKEFYSKEEALAWAEKFIENPEALAAYFLELNAESPYSHYTMTPGTHVRIITVTSERKAYPWHWFNGHEVWWPMSIEWRWESASYRALVAKS